MWAGQIDTNGNTCTLGLVLYPASTFDGTVDYSRPYLLTASHCAGVSNMGVVDSTAAGQPDGVNTVAYDEIMDPPFGTKGCPSGTTCKRSDASVYELISTVSVSFGSIASAGSDLVIDWNFTIVQEELPFVGDLVNKTGRTTGQTGGYVTATCVTFEAGPGVALTCQNEADYDADNGDSGAPVFRYISGGDVALQGLHSGSDSTDTKRYYSAFHFVGRDVYEAYGVNLTACADASSCAYLK